MRRSANLSAYITFILLGYLSFFYFVSQTFALDPSIPTEGLPTNLGELIQQIFGWSLMVLGIAVFVRIFYAGFIWLTAAGNTGRVSDARDKITSAVFGAILLLSAYLILYTINPDFVKGVFNLPGLGTPSSTSISTPGPDCTLSPNWQACKASNSVGLVNQVKDYLIAKGIDTTGSCGGFEIVKRVAWTLRNGGAGTLKTFHGSKCPDTGMSGDLIAYPDGSIVDILSLKDTESTTQWLPGPGPITESGVEYVSPTDPGDPAGSY